MGEGKALGEGGRARRTSPHTMTFLTSFMYTTPGLPPGGARVEKASTPAPLAAAATAIWPASCDGSVIEVTMAEGLAAAMALALALPSAPTSVPLARPVTPVAPAIT